ncbi:MAG TPA: hypothetical protein GX719_13175 [Gammaproteobacteria bacterium]|nr:hypothetical protein [Gammaproteobacteria bacterium]
MPIQDAISGENYSHKVTAEFTSQIEADNAVRMLTNQAGLPSGQITVIQPHDPNMAHKIEPETKGIGRSLARAHVTLGVGGLVAGLVLAAILVAVGPEATQSSPLMTFIALGFLLGMLGLLLGGAVSLRPDHDPMIEHTRAATDAGQWTVIAHCISSEQQDAVKNVIDYSSQSL